MCNLHRSKLDANRPLITAAEARSDIVKAFTPKKQAHTPTPLLCRIHRNHLKRYPQKTPSNNSRCKLDCRGFHSQQIQDPLGQQVYAEYHAYLEVAKTEICRGLLLDLHGQNHQQNSIGAFEVDISGKLNQQNLVFKGERFKQKV